jgi:hypothetical protein
MKLNVLTLALAATLFGSLGASAQTVIEERHDDPVVIEHDHPAPDTSVTVHENGGLLGTEHKTITKETTGSGDCATRTVHKDDLLGSKTVSKTNCD